MTNVPKGQYIDLAQASVITAEHRLAHPAGDCILGECFDAGLVQGILDQAGCEGLRVYFGKKMNQPCVVMVGCDSAGNDMIDGHILEMGLPCPSDCSSPNPLNS